MQLSQYVRSVVVVLVLALGMFGAGTAIATAQNHYEGAIGPGALYEIDVPAIWNGDLVLYAHGIVQASLPVALPSNQDNYAAIRSDLLASGFAVAASSYSSNGWALADAVRRTHQLSGIASSRIGQPRRTYLMGHSMGALAVVKLAERYPTQYDGVLAICGPLGGGLAELQYAGDARVTFEYYFPGVLPGDAFDVPPGTLYLSPFEPGGPSPLFVSVFTALSANPAATFQWATAAKLPFINQTELGNSSLYVIGFLLRYTNDFIERVNGKMPYDNQGVEYQVTVSPNPAINASLSAQLNAGVERFTADRAALNFYEHNYTPSGQLESPVLTLHTTRDPAIPIRHEELFAESVAAAGRSDWLVQRSVNRWGHCALSPGEVGAAFHDLVGWASSGQRP